MDAAGKDGTIRHVMSGVNPQGVEVTSFKVPSELERDHDYLWRAALHLPARGMIGIFNRSYYEEVLIVRVHPQILVSQKMPEASKGGDVWRRRYREINDWERYLTDNGTEDRQAVPQRLEGRADAPVPRPDRSSRRRTGSSPPRTPAERVHWDEYQKAFADLLSNTSTPWAPWHVIPADRKWFMRLSAAAVILDALMELDPTWPEPTAEAREEMRKAKAELLAEDGGAPPAGA